MVFEKIKGMIVEQLLIDDPNSITMETSFVDDLEADSLDIVELIMAIESEYGITISDEEVETMRTVGDVVNYIQDNAN